MGQTCNISSSSWALFCRILSKRFCFSSWKMTTHTHTFIICHVYLYFKYINTQKTDKVYELLPPPFLFIIIILSSPSVSVCQKATDVTLTDGVRLFKHTHCVPYEHNACVSISICIIMYLPVSLVHTRTQMIRPRKKKCITKCWKQIKYILWVYMHINKLTRDISIYTRFWNNQVVPPVTQSGLR